MPQALNAVDPEKNMSGLQKRLLEVWGWNYREKANGKGRHKQNYSTNRHSSSRIWGPARGQLEGRAWKVEQVKKSPTCPAEWSPWTQSSWQEAIILDFFFLGGGTQWWKPVEMTLSIVTLGKRNLFRKPGTLINAKTKPKTPTFMDFLWTCCQKTRASEPHILSPSHCPCPSLPEPLFFS